MNPSSSGYSWNNPPPPGTEFDSPDEDSNFSSQKNESTSRSSAHAIDYIEPFVKKPIIEAPEENESSERIRYKSRSKSPERHKRRRRSKSHSRSRRSRSRSRSRSRNRRRRSRSRSRRRRRRHSSSRSKSRSRSPSYRGRHKKHSRRYSRSRSRSKTRNRRSRSRSYSRSKSHRRDRDSKKKSRSPRVKEEPHDEDNVEKYVDGDIIGEEDMKIEEPEYETYETEQNQEPEYDNNPIPFKNDGSFLEMFKKMQEMQKVKEEPAEPPEPKKPLLPAFGKRRGGKVLKTGMVAKIRNVEEESGNAQDAWAIYMKEVRRYKEVHCDDDSKTRPLVK